MNLDKLVANQHPSLVEAREWYHKINEKLGKPLPTEAYIGVLQRSLRKRALGFSSIMEFEGGEKIVVITIHPRMLWVSTTWMAVLTHEMTHLTNPDLECCTHEFMDKVVELRKQTLDPNEWNLM